MNASEQKEVHRVMDTHFIGRWLKSSHLHCRDCGNVLKFLCRLPYRSIGGVSALGICTHCRLIMVESEHDKPKWVSLETK